MYQLNPKFYKKALLLLFDWSKIFGRNIVHKRGKIKQITHHCYSQNLILY